MKIVCQNIPHETSPAIADFYEQQIIVNKPVFSRFDKFTRRYILEHEKGHLLLNTMDELQADNYAFNRLAGKEPYSLRKSIAALQAALPFTHPAHEARLREQVRRSLLWDAQHGNPAAWDELQALDRYAGFDYTTYQGSYAERRNNYWKEALTKLSVDTVAEGFKLDTPTIVLLGVFLVLIVMAVKYGFKI